MTYADTTVALSSTYVYRVAAQNVAGTSAWSNPATVAVAAPAAPVILTGTAVAAGHEPDGRRSPGALCPTATSYVIQRSQSPTFATGVTSATVGAVTTLHDRQHQPHRPTGTSGCTASERARSVRLVGHAGR